MSTSANPLDQAFSELARVVAGRSVLTKAPTVTTTRGVITAITPTLQVRVGIAETATTATNSVPGYTPVVGHVVTVVRQSRRLFITGKI